MKLLFISQNMPYPPYRDGARLKTYNLIKYLSSYNEIYFITFCTQLETTYIDNIAPFCSQIKTVPIREKLNIPGKIKKLILNAIDPRRCNSKAMELEIRIALDSWKPDIAHVDLPMMSPYINIISGIPSVIASHDTISIYAYKNWKMSKQFLNKILWYWLYRQRRWIETHFYPQYDACTLVSDEDKQTLRKYCPNLRIEVIPNGVDVEYFHPGNLQQNDNQAVPTIGLFGGMDFRPNVDAVEYFTSEIYPHIKKSVPGVRFIIIGRNPPDHIKSLENNEDIIVTGEVEDIRIYYERVSVVVSPIRLGSGIKNTVLQAMSMSKPVVATPQAVKAIAAEHRVHLFVAKDPDLFSRQVVSLLANKGLQNTIGNNARSLIEKKYSWEAHARAFQKLYESITE